MKQHMNDKRASTIQKQDSQADLGLQKKAEESRVLVCYNPLDNIACNIGDKTCSAKHVLAIQRTGLLHPMNKSQKIQSLTRLQQQYGNRFVQRVIAEHATQAGPQGYSEGIVQRAPEPKSEAKKGETEVPKKAAAFIVDLTTPEKFPKIDHSKTEDDLGAWEKAVFVYTLRFAYSSESITMPDGTSGSYVSDFSMSFSEPSFSIYIARHIRENAYSKVKPVGDRITWMKIYFRIRTHAYSHIKRYRETASKMEEKTHEFVDTLPTVDKPLAVPQADLDDYLIKLGEYLNVLVQLRLWKTTCDWEKEDYPKLFKGIHGVFGTLKVNCAPRPKLPATPMLPIPVHGKRKSGR